MTVRHLVPLSISDPTGIYDISYFKKGFLTSKTDKQLTILLSWKFEFYLELVVVIHRYTYH